MSRKHQSGISLIIVAVLLVVIGTAVGTMVMRKDREVEWNPKTGSVTDINRVKNALISFQRANHRLPCVAPRNALPNTPSYGEEIVDCASGTAATGGTIRINIGSEYLRIGAVPHKTLGLSETNAEDQWKNRMTYAVTESLTDVFQFSTHSGAIIVADETNGTVTNDAAFVVLSHGKDGKGAYGGKSGTVGRTCLSTDGKDQANCDDANATFVLAEMNSAAGANFFDDMVAWAPVDGVAQSTNMPCMVPTTGDATWGSGCTSNGYTNMANGGSQSASNTNTGTHTGSVTLGCDNGNLTYTGGTCFLHCQPSTQTWTDCAGDVPLVNHGATSSAIANTNSGFTGNATFNCVNGVLSIDSQSCTPVATGCGAQPVSWSGDCAGGLGSSLAEGANTSINNTNSGFTGSVVVTCTAGNLVQSGASCNPVSCDAWTRLCDTGPMESAQLACEGSGGTFETQGGSMQMDCLGNTEPSFMTRCCGGTPTPCTPDGSPPGGGGCCNPDTDGNGQCGTQCTPCVTYVGMEWDIYGSGDSNASCWDFTRADCSVETDMQPCDGVNSTPPPGQTACSAPPSSDPCFDNGYGTGCLMSGSDYGTGCIGTDIFGNGTVCCAGCTPTGASCAPVSKSWTVGGHNCSATTDATVADGALATATDSMGFRGTPTGQAQFRCNNGTLAASPEAGATCDIGSLCSAGQCEVYDSACGWMCREDGEIWVETSATPSCWRYRCDSGTQIQLSHETMCQNMCMESP